MEIEETVGNTKEKEKEKKGQVLKLTKVRVEILVRVTSFSIAL
jgi:hypothetical protein